MKVLDLFSGIGGFSLGLERAGMRTVAFCEVDPKCREVLRKHWPSVPIYEDIRSLDPKEIEFEVVCGGFPCQDISLAGTGEGLEGSRSGLWWEFHRIIKEARPKWAIIENVSALRGRGLDQVLRSLTEVGYDAQWHCVSASALGAPHQRDRVWIVAYQQEMAHTLSPRLQGGERLRHNLEEAIRGWTTAPRPASERCPISGGQIYSWHLEPELGRVADGIPGRMDRLKQLGNSVVPQIPELIGKAILKFEQETED